MLCHKRRLNLLNLLLLQVAVSVNVAIWCSYVWLPYLCSLHVLPTFVIKINYVYSPKILFLFSLKTFPLTANFSLLKNRCGQTHMKEYEICEHVCNI